jgi:hypothetical protein
LDGGPRSIAAMKVKLALTAELVVGFAYHQAKVLN